MISFPNKNVPADGQFTIGRLAKKVQIPASTVRYYERIGLLEPEDRSQGNYRLYGRASLRRLCSERLRGRRLGLSPFRRAA